MNTAQSVSGNQHTYNIVPQIPAGSRPGQTCFFCVFPTGLSSLDYLNFGLPLWIISSFCRFFVIWLYTHTNYLYLKKQWADTKLHKKQRNIESSINYWNILVVCAFKLSTSVSAAVRLEIRNKSIVPAERYWLPPGRLLLNTVTRTT